MLVGELEGLDETDGLLDGAADGEVVDGDLAGDAIWVMVVSTKPVSNQHRQDEKRQTTGALGSMMKRPRRAIPDSGMRTP